MEMEANKYKLAGWAALASALTFLISISILIFHDVLYQPALKGGSGHLETVLAAFIINILSTACGVYALLKFRQLLRERYDFHAVDDLILVLIFGGIIISGLAYSGRLAGHSMAFLFILAFAGIIMGIIGIVFSLRLLKVPGSLNGYLKPLAYTELIGSICFTLVFLTPIGLVMMIIFNILLGVVFLSRDTSLEEVEFV